MAALLLVLGCSGEPAMKEKVFRYRLRQDPPTLDPARVTDQTSAAVVRRIHAGLVDFDPKTMRIVPRVAESWEISGDGTVYTFRLRPDVKFHTGRKVTAEDVAWSLRRILDPRTRSQRAWILDPVVGAAAFADGRSERVEGIEVVDSSTLRLTLERAHAPFLGQLAMENTAILPPEVYDDDAPNPAYLRQPVGCGPFRLSEWVHSNYMTLTAFDDYYGGRPELDRVIFRFIENLTTSLEEYRAGGLDFLDEVATGQRRALVDELGSEMHRWPQLAISFYGFNHQLPPFKGNRALRQAFNYAVDKDYICRVLQEGKDIPQTGVLPPGIPGHNPSLRGYPYDPARARQLLAEAGYPGGEGLPDITFWYNTNENHQRVATQVQSDLAAIGVKILLRNLDWASYLKAVEGEPGGNSEVSFYRMGWFADYPDPDNFLTVLLHSGNWGPEGNHSRYSNPEFDRLVDQARALTRMEDRIPLYRRAEQIAVDDAAWLFLYYYQDEALVKPFVQGLVLPALGDHMAPLESVHLAKH
jgi:peptide/nickel transport system substrate-binding protein/oligopeptide transport system substrate-binding protein